AGALAADRRDRREVLAARGVEVEELHAVAGEVLCEHRVERGIVEIAGLQDRVARGELHGRGIREDDAVARDDERARLIECRSGVTNAPRNVPSGKLMLMYLIPARPSRRSCIRTSTSSSVRAGSAGMRSWPSTGSA